MARVRQSLLPLPALTGSSHTRFLFYSFSSFSFLRQGMCSRGLLPTFFLKDLKGEEHADMCL